MDKDGHLFVLSRTDDVINVSAHRLSTSEMEEVLLSFEGVIMEAAVVGIADKLRGSVPLGFAVLKKDVPRDQETLEKIEKDIIARVRHEIGAIACFKRVLFVNQLPKTRSGKILRKTLRQMADNSDYKVPPTIDDPNVLADIKSLMESHGFSVKSPLN